MHDHELLRDVRDRGIDNKTRHDEIGVLGAVILQGTVAESQRLGVRPEHFESRDHERIYRLLCEACAEYPGEGRPLGIPFVVKNSVSEADYECLRSMRGDS